MTTGHHTEMIKPSFIETTRHVAGKAGAALTLTTTTISATTISWWSAIVHEHDRAAERTSAPRSKPSKRNWPSGVNGRLTARLSEPSDSPTETMSRTRNRLRRFQPTSRCASRRTRKVGCPSACQNTDKGAPRYCRRMISCFIDSYRAKRLTRTMLYRTIAWICPCHAGHSDLSVCVRQFRGLNV